MLPSHYYYQPWNMVPPPVALAEPYQRRMPKRQQPMLPGVQMGVPSNLIGAPQNSQTPPSGGGHHRHQQQHHHCSQLPVGSKHIAYVTHVEDGPLSFAINLKKDKDEILPQIIMVLSSSVPILNTNPLLPGSMVVGRSSQDLTLRRAVVMHVRAETCGIYYMDYGNSEELPHSEIFQLPPSLSGYGALALRFALANCRKVRVSEEMKENFRKLVLRKEVMLTVSPSECSPLIQYCEIYLEGHNVKDYLMAINNQKVFYSPQYRPKERNVDVVVSFVDSPRQFYVQYLEEERTQLQIQTELANYCMSRQHVYLSPSEVEIGMPVIALFSQDNSWYRAQVVDVDINYITVFYVDFGNRDTVTVHSLMKMPPELVTQWNMQAVECCLMGFEDFLPDTVTANFMEASTLGLQFKLRLQSITTTDRLVVDLITNDNQSIAELVKTTATQAKTSVSTSSMILAGEPSLTITCEDNKRNVYTNDNFFNRNKAPKSHESEKREQQQTENRVSEPKWRNKEEKSGGYYNKESERSNRGAPPSWKKESSNRWNNGEEGNNNEKKWKGNDKMKQDGDYSDRKWKGDRGSNERSDENSEKSDRRWKGGDRDGERFSGDNHGKYRRRESGEETNNRGSKWSEQSRGSENNTEESNSRRKWNNEGSRNTGGHWEEKGGGSRGSNRNRGSDDSASNSSRQGSGGGGSNKWNSREKRNDRNGDDNRKWKNKSSGDDYSSKHNKVVMKEIHIPTASENWEDENSVQAPVVVSKYKTYSMPEGSVWKVQVSHVASPELFYVQGADSQGSLQALRDLIESDTEYSKRALSPASWLLGTPVLARFSEDSLMYRAQISKMPISSKVGVLFVDYGNSETVGVNEVYLLTENEGRGMCEAVRCQLGDLVSPGKSKTWEHPAEVYQGYFGQETLLMRVHTVKYVDAELVLMVSLTRPDGTTVSEALVEDSKALPNGELWPAAEWTDDIPKSFSEPPLLREVCQVPPSSLKKKGEWKESFNLLVGQCFIGAVTAVGGDAFIVNIEECNLLVLCTSTQGPLAVIERAIIEVHEVLSDRLCVTVYDTEGKMIGDATKKTCPLVGLPVITTEMTVYVSHSEGGFVWLQRSEDADAIARLLDAMYKEYEDAPSEESVTWAVGSFCAARSPADTNWYRARLESLSPFVVRYVDYGNTETVEAGDLRVLSSKMVDNTPHELALKAKMAVAWTSEDGKSQVMEHLESIELTARLMSRDYGEWTVDLLLEDGSNVAEKLAAASLASPDPESPFLLLNSDISRCLKGGSEEAVFVCHIDSPSHFWVHLMRDEEPLEELQSRIQALVESPQGDSPPGPDDTLFIAQYNADQTWYRALDLANDQVRFIDYGNVDAVTLKKKLPDEMKKPASGYAIPVYLPVLPIEENWEPATMALFEDLIEKAAHTTARVLSINYKIVIDLILDGKSLIEELVTSGKALRDLVILAPPSLAPSEAEVYLTHSNTLNDFYVTDNSLTSQLEELCEDIKNADALPKATNLRVSDLVIAQYPDDGMWYRASILALEPSISVLFIDYGNTSSVTDVRVVPKKWKTVPPFAIHCSLGIRHETEEAFDKFLELMADGNAILKMKIVKGGVPNIVSLTLDGIPIRDSLVQEKDEEVGTGVYISYSDGPNSFYIQQESNMKSIDGMVETMLGAEGFEEIQPQVGARLGAKFPDDECWYRAEVLSVEPKISVRFIDYGNCSEVSEFRKLPVSVAEIPQMAVHCSLNLPEPVSNEMNEKFHELGGECSTLFSMTLQKEGDPQIVKLTLQNSDVVALLTAPNLTSEKLNKSTKESDTITEAVDEHLPSEVYISHCTSLNDFYAQDKSKSNLLDQMVGQMLDANDFPEVGTLTIGSLVIAKFVEDDSWYRAQVLSVDPQVIVIFIDYGNKSEATDFREMPDSLRAIPPLARHCSLGVSQNDDPQMEAKFMEMAGEGTTVFNMTLVQEGKPNIVALSLDGKNLTELLSKNEVQEPNSDSDNNNVVKEFKTDPAEVFVGHYNSPNDFFVQDANAMTLLEELSRSLLVADGFERIQNPSVGDLIVAQFPKDQMWYRASVLSNQPQVSVLFVDYGNTAEVTNFRAIPKELAFFRPAAIHCSLGLSVANEVVSKKFAELAAEGETLFKMTLIKEGDPKVVKLSLNGQSVADLIAELETEDNCITENTNSDGKVMLNGNSEDSVETCENYATDIIPKKSDLELPIDQKAKPEVDVQCADNLIKEEAETARNASTVAKKPDEEGQVFISFCKSPNDFYIQDEASTPALEELTNCLLNAEKFKIVLDPKVGELIAAQSPDDELWYRGLVLSNKPQISVLFIDYGNATEVGDYRALPPELATIKRIAMHCSLNLSHVTDETNAKFMELAGNGITPFRMTVIKPGDVNVVKLSLNGRSVSELLMNQELQVNGIPTSVEEAITTNSKHDVCICYCDSPNDFFIQYATVTTALEELSYKLSAAEGFDKILDPKIGDLIAAQFPEDELWYRASVLSKEPQISVIFVDYGNTAEVTNFRVLPAELSSIPPMAMHCSLGLDRLGNDVKAKFTELAAGGVTVFSMTLVTEDVKNLVKLSLNGQDVTELLPMEERDPVQIYVSYAEGPNLFYAQDDAKSASLELITETLLDAENFKVIDEPEVGSLVVAMAEDKLWYRARVISVEPQLRAFYIDFGNTSSTIVSVRELPETLRDIPPIAELCSLGVPGEPSEEANSKFIELTVGSLALLDMTLRQDGSPKIVQLSLHKKDLLEHLTQILSEEVTVCHVDSVSEFYVQRTSQLDEMENITDNLFKNAAGFEKLQDVKIGDLVCAQSPDDMHWYRCLVTSLQPTIVVRSIDTGEVMEVGETRLLPDEVKGFDKLARRCKLALPPEASGWPIDVDLRFKKIVSMGKSKFLLVPRLLSSEEVDLVEEGSQRRLSSLLLSQSELSEDSGLSERIDSALQDTEDLEPLDGPTGTIRPPLATAKQEGTPYCENKTVDASQGENN